MNGNYRAFGVSDTLPNQFTAESVANLLQVLQLNSVNNQQMNQMSSNGMTEHGHLGSTHLQNPLAYFNPYVMQFKGYLPPALGGPASAASKWVKQYKTVMCEPWLMTGFCSFGNDCRYAHGDDELRPAFSKPLPRNMSKYKTKLCEKYTKHGICPYGENCFFIHPGIDNSYQQPQQIYSASTGHWLMNENGYGARHGFSASSPATSRADFGRTYSLPSRGSRGGSPRSLNLSPILATIQEETPADNDQLASIFDGTLLQHQLKAQLEMQLEESERQNDAIELSLLKAQLEKQQRFSVDQDSATEMGIMPPFDFDSVTDVVFNTEPRLSTERNEYWGIFTPSSPGSI